VANLIKQPTPERAADPLIATGGTGPDRCRQLTHPNAHRPITEGFAMSLRTWLRPFAAVTAAAAAAATTALLVFAPAADATSQTPPAAGNHLNRRGRDRAWPQHFG
jgi:hypothetical protein